MMSSDVDYNLQGIHFYFAFDLFQSIQYLKVPTTTSKLWVVVRIKRNTFIFKYTPTKGFLSSDIIFLYDFNMCWGWKLGSTNTIQ